MSNAFYIASFIVIAASLVVWFIPTTKPYNPVFLSAAWGLLGLANATAAHSTINIVGSIVFFSVAIAYLVRFVGDSRKQKEQP
jgi:uncharacterized membrane protein YhfC